MEVISRQSMTEVKSVLVNGKTHDIGTVKVFSTQPALARFIPPKLGLALSWVHLDSDRELAAHRHDEPSLILVCEGAGEVFGALEQTIAAGDAILVPPGKLHGFRGRAGGFWALSIQFTGMALYERAEAPRVTFEAAANTESGDTLIKRNTEYLTRFKQSKLMKSMALPTMQNPFVKDALLDCLQVWSDYFQRLLHLRFALTEDESHRAVASKHMAEEIGHNENLRRQRGLRNAWVCDASMRSSMDWFKRSFVEGSDLERTVLMHFVLEASGEAFHAEAAPLFSHLPHFREHADDDGGHATIGYELVSAPPHDLLPGLHSMLDQGWQQMTALCDRMAAIALMAHPSQSVAVRA